MGAEVGSDPVRERVAQLDIWFGRVDPEPLLGGITNKNFLVRDRGRRYVVRTGGDIIVHGIVRANELAATRAAEAAGVGPAVIHAQPGILVIDFIDGRTFKPEDVRDARNLDRLVDLVRRCHCDVARALRGPAPMFWPFHVIRDYVHTLKDSTSQHRSLLPDLLARGERLESSVGAIDVVFGHNDLLAANIMDDGRRLWLLDWEYAGFNSPLFDLGGLASNSEMPQGLTEALLASYFARPVDDDLRVKAAAMTSASLLRETLWAMVSEVHSTVEFDYAAYTAENLARFEASFAHFLALERS